MRKELTEQQKSGIRKIESIDDFLHDIQICFGNYKPGMYDMAKAKFKGLEVQNLRSLYNAIIDHWGFQRPPEIKHIYEIASDSGISITHNIKKHNYVLVCRNCKRKRPLDAIRCPECGKLETVVAKGKLEADDLFYEGDII